VRWPSPQTRGW